MDSRTGGGGRLWQSGGGGGGGGWPESKEGPGGFGRMGDSNGYFSSSRVVAPFDGGGGGKSNSYGNGGGKGFSPGYGGKGDSNGYSTGGKGDSNGYSNGHGNGYSNGSKGDSNGYGSKGDSNGYSNGAKGGNNGYGGIAMAMAARTMAMPTAMAPQGPFDSRGGGKSESYAKGGGKSDSNGFGSNGGSNGYSNGHSNVYSNGGKGDRNGYGSKGDNNSYGNGAQGHSNGYGAKGDSNGFGGSYGKGGGNNDGYSKGGGNGSYGKGGAYDFGEGARYSDLGANLQDVDWSKEDVAPVGKVSGSYLAAAGARGKSEIEAWKHENGIQTWGRDVANPILTFEETGFPQFMLDSFYRQNFKAPSLIQQAGWGPAMAGRDVVGVAKTGSGKTLAFGIPGLLHIAAQPRLNRGDGPLMLVLAPTRELGQQIHVELQKVMPNTLRGAIIFGGAPKYDQKRELRWGVHVLVATPGRLIDFIETGVTNLMRVTYLVMDEADRMLDMGFEPDVRKIVGQCPPNRQTLLWSATWPTAIQRLARDFQQDMVHIQVGSTELSANNDITQKIIMTHGWQQKQEEIVKQLWDLDQQGIKKVLVFSSTKRGAEELSNVIRQAGFLTGAIHGDKEQSQREMALSHLKSKPRFVLVATDVASRGLDIPKLPAVINFDFPDQLEDYVHRIGRTGRAGNQGLAITFFTAAKDCGHAAKLIQILRKAGQQIPHGLERCTTMTPPEKDRSKWGKKSGGGGGGGGRGGGWSGGGGGGGSWGNYTR